MLDFFLLLLYTIKRARAVSESELLKYLQLWRNWHTRMIQVHVRVNWVRVQVPPTA